MESQFLEAVVKQKEGRIEELKHAIERLIRMTKYPRLLDMMNKQLNFERLEIKKTDDVQDQFLAPEIMTAI